MNNDLLKIGSRVKQARRAKHMTQQQLANAAGISLSYVSHIENGRQSMHVLTLIALCDALDVSADQLIRDVPESTSHIAQEIERELSSCTQKEREAILQLVQSMKQSLSTLKGNDNK